MMKPDNYIMDLIVRKLNNEISQSEESELNAWLNHSADHQEEYDQYRKLWEAGEELINEHHFDTGDAWRKIDGRIRGAAPIVPFKKRTPLSRQNLLLAASIAALAGIALFYIFRDSSNSSWQQIAATNANQIVTLPDGSVITLRKGSVLRYTGDFDKNGRRTELEGEAFFDIKRDEHKTFSVQTSRAIVEVLGTSFLVRETGSKDEVVVGSGKVRFAWRKDEKQEVILEKAQRATLTEGQFKKDTVLNANYRAWESGKLVFNNTPFREALNDIGDYYNLEIEFDPEVENDVRSISINAEFDNQSLSQVSEEIQMMTGLTISQKGSTLSVQR